MAAAAAAVVVLVLFVRVENIGVGGIGTMSAGKQRLVGVGEAGCMLLGSELAGGWSKRKRVSHRLVGGKRRMLQLIWREMLRSVVQD